MGFPCRCYVPAVLGREPGEPESCPLLPFPLWRSGALCVRLSGPGHSMQHRGTLGRDLPLCGGCRGLVPVGDAPVHPDPTVCSLQLWWHRHRLLTAPLAVSGLSRCCALRVYEEGFANLCVGRRVPAACLLPAHRCRPLHTCAWSRAAPPCQGPADPACLPHETSLQQGAEKCPSVSF